MTNKVTNKVKTSVMVDKDLKDRASEAGISLSFALEFGLKILLEDNVIRRLDKQQKHLDIRINALSARIRRVESDVIKLNDELSELKKVVYDELQKKVNEVLGQIKAGTR